MPVEDYSSRTIWGIHGGRTGEADSIFLKKNPMAPGWVEMGDLTPLSPDRAFKARIVPPGPDGGIGIIAHRDELGFEPPIVKVQVKSTEGSTGDPTVSQLIGKLDLSEHGLFITLGTYTSQARNTARNQNNPLKRVYVPEPLEED
jgi:predicted Mrr-cat superfamily restriction endonuclease